MKIGMVAPLYESCPPKLYGGTERVVALLCNNLVDLGHEVTLFASGDSNTKACLIPIAEEGLRLVRPPVYDPYAYITKQVGSVVDHAHEFDIIHNHIDFTPFPFIAGSPCPWVTTLHWRVDLAGFKDVYEYFKDVALVSISYSQRIPLPKNNWAGNIYHGIDLSVVKPNYSPGKYLAFLGRFSPEKGIERAIAVSKASGIPLKIAAKLNSEDQEFYDAKVKGLIDGKHIEYIGEIAEADKTEFLSNAMALIFPIDWPEPFGLAVIEAYACGTPVLVRPFGSMPEIVEDGKTGFLRYSVDELSDATKQLETIDRHYVRQFAEENFSVALMVKNYLKLYEKCISGHPSSHRSLARKVRSRVSSLLSR